MRRRRRPERIDVPPWTLMFVQEDWAEPDAQEQRMGTTGDPLWDHWHAERRWWAAKREYYRENPAAGEQAFNDLVNREYSARQRAALRGEDPEPGRHLRPV